MAGVTAEAMNVEVRRELGIQRKRRKAAERREIRSPVGLAQPKDRSLAYTDMKSAKAEENVLRLLFSDQKLITVAEKDLQPAWFSAPVLRKIYERVLELYAGRLLPMSCNEPWVETRSLTLHVQYRIALFQVLEACKRKGENERIVKLCRRAIELDLRGAPVSGDDPGFGDPGPP